VNDIELCCNCGTFGIEYMDSEQDVWHVILDYVAQVQLLEQQQIDIRQLPYQEHEELLMVQPDLTATTALADMKPLSASPLPTASQTCPMLNCGLALRHAMHLAAVPTALNVTRGRHGCHATTLQCPSRMCPWQTWRPTSSQPARNSTTQPRLVASAALPLPNQLCASLLSLHHAIKKRGKGYYLSRRRLLPQRNLTSTGHLKNM
jgi:hypothetical protein